MRRKEGLMVRMVTLGAVVGLLLVAPLALRAQEVSADNGRTTVPARDASAAEPQVPVRVIPGDNGKVQIQLPDPNTPIIETKSREVSTDNGRSSVAESDGARVQCNGCSPVSRPLMNRGAVTLKYLKDNGTLPSSLLRLTSGQIDALLRGKSWSSAIIAAPDDKLYQRMLAFDQNGRGRWLNFLGGPRTYSTLCRFKVDDDMLCLECAPNLAQCMMIYQDEKIKDFVLAYDPERGQVDIYDWILPSRWEDNRFLAPK